MNIHIEDVEGSKYLASLGFHVVEFRPRDEKGCILATIPAPYISLVVVGLSLEEPEKSRPLDVPSIVREFKPRNTMNDFAMAVIRDYSRSSADGVSYLV